MLLVDGAPLRTKSFNLDSLLLLYPALKKHSESFAQTPVRYISDPRQVLYLAQKEYAVLTKNDAQFRLIGSDDATTCHILVAKSSISGTICVAHLDSADEACFYAMLEDYVSQLEPLEDIEISIVGGYEDENGLSARLLAELLTLLNNWSFRKLELVTLCVGSLNTTLHNGHPVPVIYGLAADLYLGHVFPAQFNADIRGPLPALRAARFLSNEPVLANAYNTSMNCFQIEPFEYRPPPHLHRLLQQAPSFFSRHFSTSPQAEPPHFAWHIKECFQFVYEHPEPSRTVFKHNKPVYCKVNDDGKWSMFYPQQT